MSPKARAYVVLVFGILVVAWAAILIRWAGEAPSLVIAAGRLTAASLILAPVALAHQAPRELRTLSRRDFLLALLAGLALAVHFATWITSVRMTTIATSAVLVETNPLFVAILSWLFLRERIGPLTAVGIGMAIAGSVVIGLSELGAGPAQLTGQALLGDLLALAGGLMAAIYFILGRRLRQRLSIIAYIWPVYTTAAVVLLLLCLFTGQKLTGYAPSTYLMILLLAVGPQLLGHSSLNYALGQLSATLVTVAALGEPIGSAVLALLLLGEVPSWLTLGGGGLILLGIGLASFGERGAGDRNPVTEFPDTQ
jgi:drug/metabolite transporter (DMT)-like permease